MSWERDPLWKLRHSLAALSLAMLLSLFLAAFAGRWIGDLLGDRYELRATSFLVLMVYALVGAGVMFARIQAYPARTLSLRCLLQWLGRVWLWPLLLGTRNKGKEDRREADAKKPTPPER